jgi:hypothetical protein
VLNSTALCAKLRRIIFTTRSLCFIELCNLLLREVRASWYRDRYSRSAPTFVGRFSVNQSTAGAEYIAHRLG